MPPQWPDLVLSTDVPDIELYVLVRDGLDVEADGGDGGDVLVKLELVENSYGGEVLVVKPKEQVVPDFRKGEVG